MHDLVLRQANVLGQAGPRDVAIDNATVTRCESAISEKGHEELTAVGQLLTPAFVDSHVHLDKAFLWESPGIHGKVGPSFFAALREFKRGARKAEIRSRMERALDLAVRHGTTAMRAQIDVDDVIGLTGLEAALEIREQWRPWLRLQLVAFPQEGLLGRPGLLDLLRRGIEAGADVVGGAPSFDSVSVADHLEAVFDLAQAFDRDVDLHVDLNTPSECPAAEWELAHVARLTQASGWQGRVSVAHLRGLGAMTPEQAHPLVEMLATSGICVTIVPGAELGTARRWWDPPSSDIRRVMTNAEALINGGVRVAYSTGHVGDPWNPYGNADMLRDGLLLAGALSLGEPTVAGVPILQLGTQEPWLGMRLDGPGHITPGRVADLVLLDAPDPDIALRQQAARRLVLKDGRAVARSIEQTWTAWGA